MSSEYSQSISLYTTRSLICFSLSFLLLLIYFSLEKPDYVINTEKDNELSSRLVIIYSLIFSSSIALIFMTIDVVYHYYLHQ